MTKPKKPHVMIYTDGESAESVVAGIGPRTVASLKKEEFEARAKWDLLDELQLRVYVYAGELGKNLLFVEVF